MLIFRSEEHVEKWCNDWKQPRGATLTLEQIWQLALVWYAADRRESSWRRFTPAEAEARFAGIGLEGEFWRLGG